MQLNNRRLKSISSLILAVLFLTFFNVESAWALARKTKFGPYAIPITEQTTFLRETAAPDYWKLSQFYLPQQTSSACGLASTAMVLNFLIGVPKFWDETLVTQSALLKTVFTGPWADRVAEDGEGLMFDEFVQLMNSGLDVYKLKQYSIEVIKLTDLPKVKGLALLKRVLDENERSADDLVLAYFNQGVLTSDWDGPHISPIGAYDYTTEQVLIMDVDREWYPPYWSPVEKLYEALLRPAPADQGLLAGQIGGLLWIKRNRF